jgi:hypothetical protein
MASSTRNPKSPKSKSTALVSQDLLSKSHCKKCTFNDGCIKAVKECFPSGAIFRPFSSSAKSDSLNETWVCFPALPFDLGYTFPFPKLTSDFFEITQLCYSQAMAQMWRILWTLECINKNHGLDLGLSELKLLYRVCSHGSHQYLFKGPSKLDPPLLKVTRNGASWRQRFFFVRRDSLPELRKLPTKWVTTGRFSELLF